jgi:hypothetical protein
MGLRTFDDDFLAERTLHVRGAHGTAVEAHVQAMILLAFLAVLADAAGAAGRDGDARAGCDVGDGRTDFGDLARDFMAQHHRFLDAHHAETAVMIVVQVRAADTAGLDLDLQLLRLQGGLQRLDAQVVRCMDDEALLHVLLLK